MQSVSLDIIKLSDFWRINANVSNAHALCHVIYIYFGYYWVRCKRANFHNYRLCESDFRKLVFLPLLHPWAALDPSWIGLKRKTGRDDTNDVEIMARSKYPSIFWITLEMSIINCEFIVILTRLANCLILSRTAAIQAKAFAILEINKFQFWLYQFIIMQSCNDNWNQDLKSELTGINIKQKQQYRCKITI